VNASQAPDTVVLFSQSDKGLLSLPTSSYRWQKPEGFSSNSPGVASPTSYPGNRRAYGPTLQELQRCRVIGMVPAVSQSLAKILLHVVFSTKERRLFLRDRDHAEYGIEYIGARTLSEFTAVIGCPRVARGLATLGPILILRISDARQDVGNDKLEGRGRTANRRESHPFLIFNHAPSSLRACWTLQNRSVYGVTNR
jgi:hypothetical protein